MQRTWSKNKNRRAIRDYHRRYYGNPMFPSLSRKNSRRSDSTGTPARGIATILLALTVIVALWYAIWSPAFRVSAITVNGASPETETTVRAALAEYMGDAALWIFPRANIFFFNDAAAKIIVGSKVVLDGIDVQTKLPNTVVVDVREKITRAALDANGRLYAIDASGMVIRELGDKEAVMLGDLPPGLSAVPVEGSGVPSAQKNGLPLILLSSNDSTAIAVGSQPFSAATMAVIFQAFSRLSDVAGADVRWFTPDEPAGSVDATMQGGWEVYLSTSIPFDMQADRLALVLKDKIGKQKSSLEYVDLRYNERVFFRLKTAAPPK